MKTPFMIAEIGVNFYDTAKAEQITPMAAAKKYIDAAKRAGADAVKFQSYKAGTIVSKNSPAYWDLTREPTKTQYELFKKHDSFNKDDFMELCSYCRQNNIQFMSTPFDYDSADYLNDLCDIFKISSSDLTNLPFLNYIAEKRKPIFLSVGASYLSEVEEAVRIIKDAGCPQLCLLHCVLSYPCRAEDANLNIISTLKRIFPDLIIGYSDHTEPDKIMTILSTAYLLGAEVIEKHFTLDKTLKGNDHYHAADENDFRLAVDNIRLINTVCGSGEKTILPCEQIPRKQASRSLVLTRDMKCGEIITKDDVMPKRPGTGISPRYSNIVIGRKVTADLKEDTILDWSMI